MAKKKSTNQPIVAEEPARPEEQFRVDQSQTAPPSTRKTGSGTKSFGARSARERRTTRSVREGSSRREREHRELSQDVITELLEHPTKTVTEAQLREEYSYVVADLRSMAILSVALVVALIALATVLPK